MTKRELVVKYLWHWLGIQYSYGGDDAIEGWDCSGMVIEVLQSIGILPHKYDNTAHGLYLKFKDISIPTEEGYAGCLAFWFKNGRARHVMMMCDEAHVIGACGGGGNTKTTKDAIRDNAFVKMRPITYAGDGYKICDPINYVG
jgi:hypothetical protein